MRREVNIFFNALLFYSRIRVPKSVDCSEQALSEAFRYLPLVGIIVGAISAAIFWAASLILPLTVSVILAMVVMMLLTGGFHEDGLADFADGFGAGYNKEMILRIMKDSHIGTYGVLTLISSLLLKFALISSIDGIYNTIFAIVAAQAISRFTPVVILASSKYVRSEKSKATHSSLGVNKLSVVVAALFASAPLALFDWKVAAIYTLVAAILIIIFRAYTGRKIGGFTGDTLGALQQIAELLFYITLLAVEKI